MQAFTHGRAPLPDPSSASAEQIAGCIDHTLLKSFARRADVEKLCSEASAYGFAAVCVNPCHVGLCSRLLDGSRVKVCTVVGFPLGANLPKTKAFEAARAVEQGAGEIDTVLNVGALLSGSAAEAMMDVEEVVRASSGRPVKVILETCYLDDDLVAKACRLSVDAGAAFVKTSTGFGTAGAKAEHVRLMRGVVGDSVGVKASGGIPDWPTALAMLLAGASRIGTSAGVAIMSGLKKRLDAKSPG